MKFTKITSTVEPFHTRFLGKPALHYKVHVYRGHTRVALLYRRTAVDAHVAETKYRLLCGGAA